MEITRKITILKCNKCGNEWMPRKKNPIQCPRCKRVDWNKERKQSKKKLQGGKTKWKKQ